MFLKTQRATVATTHKWTPFLKSTLQNKVLHLLQPKATTPDK